MLHSGDFKATPLVPPSAQNSVQSNINPALTTAPPAANPTTVPNKDLRMAQAPKTKNSSIRFKRLASQSNHDNKLLKLQQSNLMLHNFNTNVHHQANQNTSRESLSLQQQLSVASAHIRKNPPQSQAPRQNREAHGSDANNRSSEPQGSTTTRLTQQQHAAHQFILNFAQSQLPTQELTSRASQASGDSTQNQRQGGLAKEGKNGLQVKNQYIHSQAMRQSVPGHGRNKNNGAVSVRIAASSGIRQFNGRVPISQMKTSTDRKSVDGRLRIARPQNPP